MPDPLALLSQQQIADRTGWSTQTTRRRLATWEALDPKFGHDGNGHGKRWRLVDITRKLVEAMQKD